jgi:hypothetical protein
MAGEGFSVQRRAGSGVLEDKQHSPNPAGFRKDPKKPKTHDLWSWAVGEHFRSLVRRVRAAAPAPACLSDKKDEIFTQS